MIRTGLFWSFILIAIMAGISAYGWHAIADGAMIARHWDLQGNANGFSSKEFILLAHPPFALGLALFMAIIPAIDPRKANLLKSSAFYLTAWIGTIALLTLVHGTIVYGAINNTAPDINVFFGFLGVFFLVLGNFMAKSKSNWFAGIRTPWTLTSEHAWAVANRTAGYLFFLTGFATLISAIFFSAQTTVMLFIAGTLTAVTVAVVTSYFAWKSDPEADRS